MSLKTKFKAEHFTDILLIALFGMAAFTASQWPAQSRLLPLVIAVSGLLLSIFKMSQDLVTRVESATDRLGSWFYTWYLAHRVSDLRTFVHFFICQVPRSPELVFVFMPCGIRDAVRLGSFRSNTSRAVARRNQLG